MSSLRNRLVTFFLALTACVVVVCSVAVETASAQGFEQINYQGKLTLPSGVAVPDGTYNMRFWIIASETAATSTAEWTEELTGSERVQVTNGLFSVMLGSTSPLTTVPFDMPLWLGVEIGGTGGSPTWDGEMSPRKVIGAVPAAFFAIRAGESSIARDADALSGISSSSFLRSDEADTMQGFSAGTLLSIIQDGAGAIARFFSGASEVFSILADGRIGVSSSTPSALLSVQGNNGSAPLFVVSTSTNWTGTTTPFVIDAAGNIGIGTSTPGQQLVVQGPTQFWDVGGDTPFIDINGSLALMSSNLDFYSNGNLEASMSAGTDEFVITDSNTGRLRISDGGSVSLHTAAGGTAFDVTGAGNVGIGTTSPVAKLSVVGTSVITGTSTLATTTISNLSLSSALGGVYGGTGLSTIAANQLLIGGAGNTWSQIATSSLGLGNGTFLGLTDTPSSYTANRVFFTNSGASAVTDSANFVFTGTNLGIGTTSPAAMLGVGGVVLADNFRAASTTAISTFAGAVGIGTSSAQYPLEIGRNGSGQSGIVHGTLAIGKSSLAMPSGNANIPLKVAGEFSQISEFISADSSNDSTVRLMQGNGVGSVWRVLGDSQDVELTTGVGHLSLLPATGKNVAVGTSSPWAKLSVQNSYGATSALFDIATTTSAANATSSLFTVRANGNVGVGSSTPSSLLTVAGNSYIGGNLRLTGALLDSTAATGTLGMVLQSTGTSTRWVATSSLGISTGATTFLGLIDTPSSYTANRIMFTNSGATALTDSANFVFTGTNLGIGTTTPAAMLGVGGLALADYFRAASTTATSTFSGDLLVGANNALRVDESAGTVSINTSAQDEELNIFGSAKSTTGYYIGDMGGINALTIEYNRIFQAYGNTELAVYSGDTIANRAGVTFQASSSPYTYFSNGGTEMMRIDSTGNVGIGSTSPSSKLTVAGNGYFGGNLTATGTLTMSGTASSSFVGAVGIGTSTPAAKFAVAGNALITGTSTLATTTISSLSLATALAATSGGTGLSTITQNQLLIGGAGNTWSQIATSSLGLGNGTFLGLTDTPSSYTANRIMFTNSGATALTDSANFVFTGTNLGIGTTTPSQMLSVAGNSVVTGSATTSGNGYIAGKLAVGTYSPSTGDLPIFEVAGANPSTRILNVGFGSLYTNVTSGGIGFSSSGGGGRDNFRFYTGTNEDFIGTNERLTIIGGTGNVGIGSSTPSSLLTVTGNGYFGGNLTATGTLSVSGVTTLASTTAARLSLAGALLDSTAATGTLGMVLQTTGTSTRWVATSTLGISSALSGGTEGFLARWTSASALSTSLLRDNGTVAGVNATSSSYTFNVQGTSGVNPFNIASSTGTSLFAVTNNGRVGIGSTTPSQLLAVAGTASVDRLIVATTTGISTIANRLDLGVTNLSHGNAGTLNIRSLGSNTSLGFKNDTIGEASILLNASVYGLSIETHTSGVPVSIRPNGAYGAYFDTDGKTGIGTSTLKSTRLTVDGGMSLSGALLDSTAATGTLGMVLQSTGTSTRWVATSTLGITGGAATFLALTDTPSSYTANRVFFTNSGATAVTDSANFTFDGSLLRVVGGLTTNASTTIGGGTASTGLTIMGNATTTGSAYFAGNVGIGTNAPGAQLHISGSSPTLRISAESPGQNSSIRLEAYDSNSNYRQSYMGLIPVDGTNQSYVGLGNGSEYLFNFRMDGNLGIGTTSPGSKLTVVGNGYFGGNITATGTLTMTGTATSSFVGALGIGTSTPFARSLTIDRSSINGTTTAGIGQYLAFANSSVGAQQFGNSTYIRTTNTATTTLVGSILRIEDSTNFGNTLRGFEVQTERGTSTLGENTAISGFARTFGVRGVTEGDAGAVYEPAGVYGETRGTTQGNAIRGYSSTITTAALLKLFQDTSTFTGTGLLMNFGNSGGSFSSTTASRFIDLQNAGTSRFTVGAYGALNIGDGTTNNNAGIQIGYGGLCVDNDGSCNASTTGRISSVSTATGNSDLAEMYFSSDDLEAGEVVYLKGGLSVGRASESTKDLVIGVVSTLPGVVMGENDVSLRPGEEGHPIALKGRVPVKVSNENGEVRKGDELMLSTVPGVVMKASSTGTVVGIALEDYDDERAYSDTFINQFGESLIVPDYTPINRVSDSRINDGCYFGGGSEAGEAPCVPLKATTTVAQYDEADALALAEAKERALRALARESSDAAVTAEGEEVSVGQIVMFVDLRYRYLDADGETMLAALSAQVGDEASDTIWRRLVTLAENFVDGVLSVFTLKADRVETNELCVDGVCVTADELQRLLEADTSGVTESPVDTTGDGSEDDTVPDTEEEATSPVQDETTVPEEVVGGENETEVADEVVETEESSPEVALEPAPEPDPIPQDTGADVGAEEVTNQAEEVTP